MRRAAILLCLAGPAVLGGCVPPGPAAPSVMALPPAGKPMAEFQQDDVNCRNYAQSMIGPNTPSSAAAQSGVGSAVVGTVVGAAAGALIGAAVGRPGAGAAIGAGTGLVAGSASGVGNGAASGASFQAAYDNAYTQCMVGRGNTVQSRAVYPVAPYYEGPPPGYYPGPVPVRPYYYGY